ncbi:MAG: hypothetical protein ABIS84_05340 [Arachnia sp.]
MSRRTRLRRGQRVALSIALVWAAALLVGAFTVPVYGGSGAEATLIGVNGASGVVVAAAPLLLAAATAFSLRLRDPHAGAGLLAWALAILSAVYSIVAILSVGIFALPVVACLIYACAVHGPRR